jgi:diguanylate cyclase (GGDEF)-like protein
MPMRILVADDEAVSRRVLETLLHGWGYEVVVACDGTAAWQRIQDKDAPQLLILDWMMPGMDGLDVCRRVRELKTDFRPYVILLTGREQKGDLVTGMSAGADDYVTKPFEPEELRVRVQAGARIVSMQTELLAQREQLRLQATHDPLTTLLNRAAIMNVLQKELNRSHHTGRPASVVMIDLDHFKRVNDTYGHEAGDAVLVEVGRRMSSRMRPYENLARFGGEEFLVVLSDCTLDGAGRMAERLRCTIAEDDFVLPQVNLTMTASLGVASSSQMENVTEKELVKLADVALYRAKAEGRNRVVLASSDDIVGVKRKEEGGG